MSRDRLITRYTLLLIPCGIALNILLSQLVLQLKLPLFLDSVGTVLVAALGGILPGIIVGFFSNVINGLSDPITLYYGVISVLIALSAAYFAKRRVFNKPVKSLLSALWFALIGGGLGSLLTWILYGFSFGSGISAPFATWIYRHSDFSEFLSQFIADMGIDVVDKIITVTIIVCVLTFLPKRFLVCFPDGLVLTADGEDYAKQLRRERLHRDKHSLRTKMILGIVVIAALLGSAATVISYVIYRDTMTEKYLHTNRGVIRLMERTIDPDSINTYLATGREDAAYHATEERLAYIQSCFSEITYMYVYQIRKDGCYVVYDLDTPELEGGTLGDRIDFDSSFEQYLPDLLAGKEIDPVISDETFGWLLTLYQPLYDADGTCVAYAAADISMDDIVSDRSSFVIRIISLLFGCATLIAAFTIWYAEKKLVDPINAMTDAAADFAYDPGDKRVVRSGRLRSLNINTGSELDHLYQALTRTADDVEQYVKDIRAQSELIAKMQENTIVSFANMVENRDMNTGTHIRHTAGYVDIIAHSLKRRGAYLPLLTDTYIENIVKSAPLHDIGKIKISDTILNKPGKLTPEEFALMKTHTTAGSAILTEVMRGIDGENYLRDAMDMARYHHEKWGGGGYPDGLSGEAIPLSARIMAVADVFDALVSKRSYKEAYPFAKAYEIILSESGKAFDPEVVAAFAEAIDEIRRLSAEN